MPGDLQPEEQSMVSWKGHHTGKDLQPEEQSMVPWKGHHLISYITNVLSNAHKIGTFGQRF
jgi:hypothetical protein